MGLNKINKSSLDLYVFTLLYPTMPLNLQLQKYKKYKKPFNKL